jgi:hypothetical protein
VETREKRLHANGTQATQVPRQFPLAHRSRHLRLPLYTVLIISTLQNLARQLRLKTTVALRARNVEVGVTAGSIGANCQVLASFLVIQTIAIRKKWATICLYLWMATNVLQLSPLHRLTSRIPDNIFKPIFCRRSKSVNWSDVGSRPYICRTTLTQVW